MSTFFIDVLGWATKRNILKGSTGTRQRTKTWEELTELAEGLSKSNLDGAKDAIGDCSVTLTNMMGCMDIDPVKVGERASVMADTVGARGDNPFDAYDMDGLVNLFIQHVSVIRPKEQPYLSLDIIPLHDSEERVEVTNRFHFVVALGALEHCARRLGLEFEACQAHAWNEIKDRTGMMVGGSFVKAENIPATAQKGLDTAVARALSNIRWGDTREDYLIRFNALLRGSLNSQFNSDGIGLYVTVTNEIGTVEQGETTPAWHNVEAVTLVARMYLDLGDGDVVVVNYHGNISIKPNGAVAYLPRTGVYEVDERTVEMVRKYHNEPNLGKQLTDMGYFPDWIARESELETTFDNGVKFIQLFFERKAKSADPAQLTAAVLV